MVDLPQTNARPRNPGGDKLLHFGTFQRQCTAYLGAQGKARGCNRGERGIYPSHKLEVGPQVPWRCVKSKFGRKALPLI